MLESGLFCTRTLVHLDDAQTVFLLIVRRVHTDAECLSFERGGITLVLLLGHIAAPAVAHTGDKAHTGHINRVLHVVLAHIQVVYPLANLSEFAINGVIGFIIGQFVLIIAIHHQIGRIERGRRAQHTQHDRCALGNAFAHTFAVSFRFILYRQTKPGIRG